MKITAKVSTKLKTKPQDSSTLGISEIIIVPEGRELRGEIVSDKNGHDSIKLYLWRKDWEYEQETPAITDDQIDTLARTVWGEARGESHTGRVAVAWVIKNRASKSPTYGWPNNVKGVCLQKWQFSCWNPNDPNRQKMLELTKHDVLFQECLGIAEDVVNSRVDDPTKGADHYYASSICAPPWAEDRKPVAIIGNHRFFKLIN